MTDYGSGTGAGYTCAVCHQWVPWVPWNTPHSCGGSTSPNPLPVFPPSGVKFTPVPDDRIADALERIAAALERLASSPSVSGQTDG